VKTSTSEIPRDILSGVVLALVCDMGLCLASEKTCHMVSFENLHYPDTYFEVQRFVTEMLQFYDKVEIYM